MNQLFTAAIRRAEAEAPFLQAALTRQPDLRAVLEAGDVAAAMVLARDVQGDAPARLRRMRDRIALTIAIADLAGAWRLEQVIEALSDFADEALDIAIREVTAAMAPDVEPRGFAVIALGKHGSRELNYSSDIDPVLIFDPETLPRRARDEPGEAAVRIARRVVDMLQTRDGDGYVFRVDLRLRPAAEATPIAIPAGAAIAHYESSALGWERAAFIRARAAAGDLIVGRGFLDAIRPFVWRRSLDFGAIGELRAMSHRIRDHHHGGQVFGPGYDLKRGRGGIREVEFFVQIQQLIHGGRDPALRAPAILDAIPALAAKGLVTPEEAQTLAGAYRLYRTIEHRLQMIDDRQTHSLPRDPEALDAVARLHGLGDGEALLALLRPHVEAVGALYDALDGAPHEPAAAPPAFAEERVAAWRGGKVRALRSPAALEAFEAVLPRLLAALAAAPDPQAALAAFDRLIDGLPSAINLFRLIQARPRLLELLIDILSHAPTLAEAIGRRPALLDRLIDATAFEPAGTVADLAAEMVGEGDVEARLDRVRHIVGEQRFALGAQIVEGVADPIEVAAGYARVAEAAVSTVADVVTGDFASRHGRVPRSELAVLALGRLGGGALTHASDLDLIYLFSGDHQADSDGQRPLGASHYYNRLAQRLSGGLSVPTSVGPLYEVDTRLRPSGAQGPITVSFDSFERYQREAAWTWEHMALTRARPIYGSAAARGALQAIIDDVLRRPRDTRALAADVVKMRRDIATHKPAAGDFDVKLGDGGLIDLEFAVHFHQLANGIGLTPALPEAIRALAEGGFVSPALWDANALLTRLIVTLRLVSPSMDVPPEASRPIVARACGAENWSALVARLAAARQCVVEEWRKVSEQA